MKIRILSDLHLDVNSGYNLRLKDKDIFTVLAGDTSGDPLMTKKWVKANVNRGIIIAGNHLVYNKRGKTIDELRNEMTEMFPMDSDVSFLDSECGNVCKEVNGILFVGTTMYTDYSYVNQSVNKDLDEEFHVKRNMLLSGRYMNDFKWGRKTELDRISPEDYKNWFETSFAKIEKIITDNEKSDNPKPVVLITHHCLSPKCISSTYVDDDMNASYVTDKEDFIRKHTSIKCVISGHVHHQANFRIKQDDGGSCVYVMNPRGYCPRCEDIPDFNENTFVNTDTWEIETIEKSKSRKTREKARMNSLMGNLAWFM